MSTIGSLLSGLNAASLRVQTSANNIANANSTYSKASDGSLKKEVYIPKDVIQINQEPNGTYASVVDSNKPPVSLYDPGNAAADANGVAQVPNVDLAEELVKVQQAASDYKATLKALEYYQNTQKALLDTFA